MVRNPHRKLDYHRFWCHVYNYLSIPHSSIIVVDYRQLRIVASQTEDAIGTPLLPPFTKKKKSQVTKDSKQTQYTMNFCDEADSTCCQYNLFQSDPQSEDVSIQYTKPSLNKCQIFLLNTFQRV